MIHPIRRALNYVAYYVPTSGYGHRPKCRGPHVKSRLMEDAHFIDLYYAENIHDLHFKVGLFEIAWCYRWMPDIEHPVTRLSGPRTGWGHMSYPDMKQGHVCLTGRRWRITLYMPIGMARKLGGYSWLKGSRV